MARNVLLAILVVALLTSVPVVGATKPTELIVGTVNDPTSLDSRINVGFTSRPMVDMIYEPLFRYDQNNKLVPHLATEWRWIAPTKLRIRLRQGVKFHNGQPFGAEDVKYTLESFVDPALRNPLAFFLGEITSVDVIDDSTVDINTSTPSRGLVRQLTYYGLIVPRNAKTPRPTGIDLTRQPVGTGPYKFVSYTPGQSFVVERNPDYWGEKPRLERITFRIIPDDGTRVAALEAGELHFAVNVPIEATNRLRARGITVDTRLTARVVYMGVRVDRWPTSDLRVRQAMAHAIDIDLLDRSVFRGLAAPARSVLGPNIWSYYPSRRYEYDPQKARRLLREAKAEGAKISIVGIRAGFISSKEVTEVVAGYLLNVGLKVDLDILEFNTFLSRLFAPDADTYGWIASWGVNSLNPDMLMTTEFHSVKGRDRDRYHNQELDRLIDQARGELDDKKAEELYKQIQQIIWRDLPWIPLFVAPDTVAYVRNLKGWYRTLGDDYFRFWNAYFE